MRIALIGYGKMGKAIEQQCLERNHEIVARIDKENVQDAHSLISQADVAIEFTRPESAVDNIKMCFKAGIPVVVGTTGWYAHFNEIEKLASSTSGALFHATNFSLGVNIFFEINRKLARLMSNQNDYSVAIKEIHHTQKLDAPSGTAISLAEQIIENHAGYAKWNLDTGVIASQDSIPISAERTDEVPGTHLVTYASEIDKIVLMHEAHNRKGFALGAVLAAEFLQGKQGIFDMTHLLEHTLS